MTTIKSHPLTDELIALRDVQYVKLADVLGRAFQHAAHLAELAPFRRIVLVEADKNGFFGSGDFVHLECGHGQYYEGHPRHVPFTQKKMRCKQCLETSTKNTKDT